MENLIKNLTDEVAILEDGVLRARAARNSGQRALAMAAEGEVDVGFAKIYARIAEIRKVLGL